MKKIIAIMFAASILFCAGCVKFRSPMYEGEIDATPLIEQPVPPAPDAPPPVK